MKPQRICLLLLGSLLCLVTRVAVGEGIRTDINPALIYWQAFAVMPDLSPDDQKHLFDTEWRNRPMDDRAGELAMRFDQTFRLARQAAASTVPCDWGVDLSAGPEALLPQLAKGKRVAQAATLRARWFVQHDRQEAARDDLIAAFVLGRNLSRDQILISALVQVAMENIIADHVVQQWPEFQTEIIGSILDAMDQAPARGTMAACMRTEKVAFYGWFIRKLEELQAKYPADEGKALQAASDLLTGMVSGESPAQSTPAAEIIKAAGNSMTGLLQYTHQMEPFYDEMEQAMKLPYAKFQPVIEELQKRIAEHPNLLLHEFFPAVLKVRVKEFRTIGRLAMVRAGYEQRVNPANGYRQVTDPFGTGPFEYSRFVLDGVDRGFKLKSQLKTPDFDEVEIFAETPGPVFYVNGPKAGQKIP